MSVRKNKNIWLGAASALSILFAGAAKADYALNMTQGVTPLSHEIYDLHMLILWICAIIGAGVFSVMFWSILNHRGCRCRAVSPQYGGGTYLDDYPGSYSGGHGISCDQDLETDGRHG